MSDELRDVPAREPLGKVKELPDPGFVTVFNRANHQYDRHRVREVNRSDSYIEEICVYFYGARLSFRWDQTTCSYSLASDFIVVG